jgi:glutaredoxin
VSSHDPIDISSLPDSPLPSVPLAVALQKAVALLETLTRDQLEDIASGNGQLVYRPGPARPVRREVPRNPASADVAAAVVDINRMSTPAEVAEYLQQYDAQFTVPVLKQIARGLGPTVNATGRTKAQLRRDIIEGTAGFRVRSAAMSGGAWAREQ